MKLAPITNEAQLTDSKGWEYKGAELAPNGRLAQIMNLLYETELEEELDWEQCLQLACYIDQEHAFDDLTPARLNEIWQEAQDNYQGDWDSAAQFAEDFFVTTGQIDEEATRNLVIDWEGTFRYSLQYDYFETFVYAKNLETHALEIRRYFWRNA